MPNGTEQQPSEFKVGQVVRAHQGTFMGTDPNLAMPITMSLLLVELDELTRRIEERVAERDIADQLDTDVVRWRIRLDNYIAENGRASAQDREAILWSVTAPLLLGWFGGPTGTEIELPSGGFPALFNTESQHGADVATPYSLANQVGVAEDWDKRRADLLLKDLETSATEVAKKGKVYFQTGWPYVVGGVTLLAFVGVGVYAYQAGKRSPLKSLRENAA